MKLVFRNSKWAQMPVRYPRPFENVRDVTAYVVNLEPCPWVTFYSEANTPYGCVVGANASAPISRAIEVGLEVRLEMLDGRVLFRRFQ